MLGQRKEGIRRPPSPSHPSSVSPPPRFREMCRAGGPGSRSRRRDAQGPALNGAGQVSVCGPRARETPHLGQVCGPRGRGWGPGSVWAAKGEGTLGPLVTTPEPEGSQKRPSPHPHRRWAGRSGPHGAPGAPGCRWAAAGTLRGGGDSKCARAWLRVPARAPAFVGKRRGGACVSPVRVRAGAWRPVCVGVWVGAGRCVCAPRGPGPPRSRVEGWRRRILGWGLFFSGKRRRGL